MTPLPPDAFSPPVTLDPRLYAPALPGGLAPRFWLRPATLEDRVAFQVELEMRDARRWPEARLLQEARSGLLALADHQPAAAIALADLDALLAGSDLSESASARLADMERPLVEAWPTYARMRRQVTLWHHWRPRLAAAWFLTGWENVVDETGAPVPFRAGPDGRPDALALLAVPDTLLVLAGYRALELMTSSGLAAKNSSAPSTSRSTRERSGAGASPPETRKRAARAGAPAKPSGARTRRSPARTGASRS